MHESKKHEPLIREGGEIGNLIRKKDWGSTSLGIITSWPQSLVTSVNLIINSKFPMFIFWGEDNICFYNDAYRPSLGNDGMHPAMLGAKGEEAWGDVFYKVAGPKIKAIKAGERATWNEDFLVPIVRNGAMEDVYWTFSYSPIYDDYSNIQGALVTVMETTEKVNSLNALEESRRKLELAVNSANLATFEVDMKTLEVNGNILLEKWFGLDKKQDIDMNQVLREAIVPKDLNRVHQAIQKAMSYDSGGDYNITYELINQQTKALLVVHAMGKVHFDENKNPVKFYGVVQDITEENYQKQKLKEAFDEISEKENQLHFAIEASKLGTWDYDPKTKTFLANQRLKEWHGKPKVKLITLEEGIEVILPKDRNRVKAAIADSLDYNTNHEYDMEYTMVHPISKKHRVVRTIGRAWFDEHKQPYRFNGIIQDITKQHEAQSKLKEAFLKIEESEKRFKRLANNAPVFIKITDIQGNITFANKLWLTFVNKPLSEVIGTPGFINTHKSDYKNCHRVYHKAYKNETVFELEYRVKRHDGRFRWVKNTAVPRYNSQGDFEGYIHAFMDIHEMKIQENQKDLFIGMASHELKTPVTSIKGYIQLLCKKYKDSDDVFLTNVLTTVDKDILTLTSLITDLLNLSKMKSGGLEITKSYFNLYELLKKTIGQIELINPKHTISYPEMCEIEMLGDQERLGQVLINFLTNAIKYAPQSCKIEVNCEVTANEVTVSVKDYGIGINKENQKRIFKRFYREEGKDEKTFPGFGIGLYVASEIIKKHKGKIGVESAKGKGSTFYFKIPRVNNI